MARVDRLENCEKTSLAEAIGTEIEERECGTRLWKLHGKAVTLRICAADSALAGAGVTGG